MATRKSKISYSIGKIKNFLKVLLHNRRGVIGVGLLILFTAVALVGPYLTPYDPVYDYYVAGDYAVPLWFKQLYGAHELSENLITMGETFSSNTSLYGNSSKFVFRTPDDTASQYVSLQYNSRVGRNSPGSASIVFERDRDTLPLQQIKVNLTTRFNYPYGNPPKRFSFRTATLTNGTGRTIEDVITEELYTMLDVPAHIRIFIEQVEGEPYDLSVKGLNTTDIRFVGPIYYLWDNMRATRPPKWNAIFANQTIWTPRSGLDSYDSEVTYTLYDPQRPSSKAVIVDWEGIILPEEGEYIYGVEIVFYDYKPNKDVKTVVYIDDISARFFGEAWGLLGTDQYGRDIFSQLIWGARVSLYIGLLSAFLSVGIGLIVGLAAGYLGGLADEIIMRITDMLLVLPWLPLLLVLIVVMGQTMHNLVLLIGLLGWMGFARVVRSQVLSLRERPFIEAAKAVGAGKFHIVTRHVLPNVMSFVYVTLALSVPSAILLEAAISWLGLYDPSVMSWGRMLHDVQAHPEAVAKWWWVLPPGLSIAAVSLSFILLGYALDEILNPRLRIRR